MSKFKGEYPASWTKEFRNAFRAARGNICERCKHPHDPVNGYALTIHHLDNDKSNCEEWNLAALCQRCHLTIQGRVNMYQDYALPHSAWMQPHVDGMKKAMAEGRWPRREISLVGGAVGLETSHRERKSPNDPSSRRDSGQR